MESKKTKLIILGVGHANQLVARDCQPAVYKAFFDKVQPDVIGVERAPLEFSRSHFYEFTHEQQHLILPYAEKNNIRLAPFDWQPSSHDQYLAWGTTDLEQPPLLREKQTYKDFLSFSLPFTYENDFFYSERDEAKEEMKKWLANVRGGEADFPRRFFLYRTFMQAMQMKQIVAEEKSKTILVVVGHMHKQDIENVLSEHADIEIVQPSSYGYPAEQEIVSNIELKDRVFSLAFNLLGVQSSLNVDWDWMEEQIAQLDGNPEAETVLFQTRFSLLLNNISSEEAIRVYENALEQMEYNGLFTYQDSAETERVDTYYDPFGNLSLKTRLLLELAREHNKLSHTFEVHQFKEQVLNQAEMNSVKKLQVEGYWHDYVLSKP